MKVVLIDYLSPIGHIPIINFYINRLYNKFDNIYLKDNIKNFQLIILVNRDKFNSIFLKKAFKPQVVKLCLKSAISFMLLLFLVNFINKHFYKKI